MGLVFGVGGVRRTWLLLYVVVCVCYGGEIVGL